MSDRCGLCNGSHVVPVRIGAIIEFYDCPNCGPMPEEKFQKMMDELERKIKEAEKKFKIAEVI